MSLGLVQTRQIIQPHRPRPLADVEARALEARIRAAIRGEVRFDDGSRALYATDGSNYRMVPIGVVIPRDADDVEATVAACRQFGAPILGRGGGTSLTGSCCNVAVVLDMSKSMNKILEIDPGRKIARVQPGVILDRLRREAERHHLTFAPDPSTHNHCCIGGMLGNNSCGIHSMMGGRTVDNIHELEILTYDGTRMRVGPTDDAEYERIVAEGGRRAEIYQGLRDLRDRYAEGIREKFPRIPRRVSGYSIDELLPEHGFQVARSLVGSESTCVLFLEATCRLVHSPPERALVVLGFHDIATAGDHVPEIAGYGPIGLEGIDDRLFEDLKQKGHEHAKLIDLFPPGGGWMLAEFGGETQEEADAAARRLLAHMERSSHVTGAKLYTDKKEERLVWELREAGLGATARIPDWPDNWEGWEDSAVPPEKVGAYLRDFRDLLNKYDYQCALYGHLGQGCIHTRINFRLKSAEGVAQMRAFKYEAADLVLRYGGSFSGEHGDGQVRGELLPRMFGPELIEAFREFKAIWDPGNKMNPGIKVEPLYRLDQDLRTGPDDRPAQPETFFRYPDDAGSFAYATERCIGVGTCRKEDSGTMCPSYMATREEKHSTRGRARLLFEMLRGDVLDGGWRDEHVHEALDLCLACKGCKSECPNNVDMASYKAEFFAHYYAGRLRPRAAYAMGLIPYWARLGSLMPEVVNALMNAPGLGDLIKFLGGVSTHRRPPAFAPATFKAWFRRRGVRRAAGPPVILWADTFNNHFHPEVAKAAVEVLEDAGFRIIVPMPDLCCGRPLYDFGMLATARRFLRRIVEALREPIRAGIPVVVLEPGCASVFRDELGNLFPNDRDAQRLRKQTLTLAEFLIREAPEYEPPRLRRKALVHAHCHHKAVLSTDAEEEVLRRLGLDYGKILDAGCCGMAGSFGFEPGKYAISMQIGEQRLLPAVRAAARDTLIVADGFSCKHQIREGTDRQALHLAQVLQMALHEAPDGPLGGYPEVFYPDVRSHGPERLQTTLRTASVLGIGAVLAGGAAYAAAARRRST